MTARIESQLADRYRIEREIGTGGMATVYLAEDVRHHRRVAIKVLHPELSAVLGSERFLKEIELTANLQHPHILPLFDSGAVDGLLYYVMPYVDGETLRRRLEREQQLPVNDALRIAKEVADALEYAHKRGVVHRDIKPENVLLHDGRPLVADFGIALAVQHAGGARMTQTGMSLGTPQYMAPEQAMGEKTVDHRADIYALGAVTYEMLSGEPPFTGPNSQAIVAKILTTDATPLTVKRRSVPPHVEAAVMTALEKLPADRFASAAEFRQALERTDSIAAPRREEPRRETRRDTRLRRKTMAIFAGAALATLVAGIVGGAWWARRDATPPRPVEFTMEVRFGEASLGAPVAISPDGSHFVYVGNTEQGRDQLMLRRLDAGDAQPLAGGTASLIRYPTFSADGENLAFYADARLRTLNIRTGTPGAAAQLQPTSGGIAWTADGRIVYSPALGRGLSIVTPGGNARQLTTVNVAGGERDHRWPRVLPGDRGVLFTIWRGPASNSSIGIASLRDGKTRELIPGYFARYSAGHLLFAVTGGALQAVRFDPRRGKVEGTPRTIAEQLGTDSASGSAYFDASADGTLVLVDTEQSFTPMLADLSGAAVDMGMPTGIYQSPRFSPRGDAIATGHQGNVWVRNIALRTFGPLTATGAFYPLWSRDGRRIYYSMNVASDVHVYSVAVDRSTDPVALLRRQGQFRTQTLSPDGRILLLRVNGAYLARQARAGRTSPSDTSLMDFYDLWSMTLDGSSTLTPWLVTDYLERAPEFSPDGRWVVYSSDESGRDEIYVRPFPGPGGRTQVSTDGGIEPAWTRDGRTLFYRNGDAFIRVPVRSTPSFEITGAAQTLFRGAYFTYPWSRQYDVHPDGRRLLLLRATRETSTIRVIVDWPSAANGRQGSAAR